MYEAWGALTDPKAFEPDSPRSFRDASVLVTQSGGYLKREDRKDLILRLKSVPAPKVQRMMRAALDEGNTPEETTTLIKEVLDDTGIIAPPRLEPLPDIKEHEVRLIAWMAVKGRTSQPTEPR